MGIGSDSLVLISDLKKQGHLAESGAVIEIGAQQLANTFLEAKDTIRELGQAFGVTAPCVANFSVTNVSFTTATTPIPPPDGGVGGGRGGASGGGTGGKPGGGFGGAGGASGGRPPPTGAAGGPGGGL